jgi:hypothetical protein
MSYRRRVAVGVLLSLLSLAHATPIIEYSGEKLSGARGVEVDGATYNVVFLDGSCTTLFNGCVASSFLEQVLTGEYNDEPSLTAGCAWDQMCDIYTPYRAGVGSPVFHVGNFLNAYAHNIRVDYPVGKDEAGIGTGKNTNFDTTNMAIATWALWSVDTKVPEPASLVLLITGLLAIKMKRR